ncbi:taste receptor type 2 member 40-like [Leptodactylus fuscus]|uniref:taste receptor type 2 member 40-like n=1 Tax=Leptodactylus fuscus TaxID=238119 RepID=UPI003F4EBE12
MTLDNDLTSLDMSNSKIEFFLSVLLLLEVISDLSSSIFIIISLCLAGFQRTTIAPLNRILISLNVSNVSFTVFMTAYLLTSSLWSYYYSVRSVFYLISYMNVYSITSISWLTAILCFFYFMKIIPSRPGVLMNIKNKIGSFILQLILMAETISVVVSFLSLQSPDEKNSTMIEVETQETRRQRLYFTSITLFLNGLPFMVIILTTLSSAWVLRMYNSQMKKNNGTLANSNVKDYRSAVQTMTGLLIFYLFVIIAVIISALEIFPERSEGYWICVMFLLSFPTGQSIFIIYGNPKLKHNLKELFSALSCRDSGE